MSHIQVTKPQWKPEENEIAFDETAMIHTCRVKISSRVKKNGNSNRIKDSRDQVYTVHYSDVAILANLANVAVVIIIIRLRGHET